MLLLVYVLISAAQSDEIESFIHFEQPLAQPVSQETPQEADIPYSTSPFVYLVALIALYLVIRLKWLAKTPKVRGN